MLLRLRSLLHRSFVSGLQVLAFQVGFQAGVWLVPLNGNTFCHIETFPPRGKERLQKVTCAENKNLEQFRFSQLLLGQVKALATKSGNLSSIPGSYTGKGENQLL